MDNRATAVDSDLQDGAVDAFFDEEPEPDLTGPGRLAAIAAYAVRDAVQGIRRRPGLAASAAVTVALCAALAGGAAVARAGIDATMARWADGVEFVVYLQPGASAADADRVGRDLAAAGGVRRVERITQDEAFEEYQRLYATDREMVEAVTPDLLPSSFRVSPERADPALIQRIIGPLASDPAVYQVVTADDAVRDVRDVSGAMSGVGTWLALVLGAVGVVLSAAMIRSSVAARREEIEVMRLVGAGRSVIAAPVVVEGVLVGATGAVAAVTLLGLVLARAARSDSAVVGALLPPGNAGGSVMAMVGLAAVAVCTVVSVLAAASALRSAR